MVDGQPFQTIGGDISSSKTSQDLPLASSTLREVTVPVFLKVKVPADDELEAEVHAVELVRAMVPLQMGDATVEFASTIRPMVA